MSKIVFFCIPAHGHTNPTLPVVKALTSAGHEVIYYSFADFRDAIEAAGARFVDCGGYDMGLGDTDGAKVARDIVAATELIVKVTLSMDEAVTRELEALKPDVVVADSVAYWGRLIAQKLGIPLVSSTTTFAFNRYSAKVMKQGIGDLFGMLFKLPKTRRLLGPLREKGYPAENILSIIGNDENTPTIVYTSPEFQPCAETFSDKYAFVGPCLRESGPAVEKSGRPLVYVSTGTVIGREYDFFRRCADAFSDGAYDVIFSVGAATDPAALGPLPKNVRAYPRVDQLAVLRSADAFVTHCGMNSVSEALYYGVPLVLRPLTPEEGGVANRVAELGAGVPLGAGEVRAAVDRVLAEQSYRDAARRIGEGFRRCGGPEAAAAAILRVVK